MILYTGIIMMAKFLKRACEQALIEKEMFEKNGLYHYTIPIGETFIFDTI